MLRKFDQNCRKRGMSVTTQRQHIYEALLQTKEHPTVDMVYGMVSAMFDSTSRATVYRALEKMAEEGLISRVLNPCSVARYDANAKTHNHLVCIHCGKTEDYDGKPGVKPSFPPCSDTGFDIIDCELVYRGICPQCKERIREEAASAQREAQLAEIVKKAAAENVGKTKAKRSAKKKAQSAAKISAKAKLKAQRAAEKAERLNK